MWVMTIAYPVDFDIAIYTSPDLIHWEEVSRFSHAGLIGLQYEVPNLVRMPVVNSSSANFDIIDEVWLMVISINPGAPLGGSITEYFPGTFNGTHFEAFDMATRIEDFGKDNYAGGYFYYAEDKEGELPVFIGWASNWQYTQVVPTGAEGWRSAMTVPRTTYLVDDALRLGWKLIEQPYDLSPVSGDELCATDDLGNDTIAIDYSDVTSGAIYWEVNCTNIPSGGVSGSSTLNFTFMSPLTGEYVATGFYFGGDYHYWVDRGHTNGFENVFFTDKFSTNSLYDGKWSVRGIIDRSIIEVFLNGGVESATNTFFATQPLSLMIVSATDLPTGMEVSVKVTGLKSAWADMESEDGIVYGNITDS